MKTQLTKATGQKQILRMVLTESEEVNAKLSKQKDVSISLEGLPIGSQLNLIHQATLAREQEKKRQEQSETWRAFCGYLDNELTTNVKLLQQLRDHARGPKTTSISLNIRPPAIAKNGTLEQYHKHLQICAEKFNFAFEMPESLEQTSIRILFVG